MKKLTPEEARVILLKGTESPYSGKYYRFNEKGDYTCKQCGALLYPSSAKFDSGSGWPSFTRPADEQMIDEHRDSSFGMVRTEVTCHNCGAHLGHVFDDGPPPTGLRYCINGVILDFEKAKATEKKFNEKKGEE